MFTLLLALVAVLKYNSSAWFSVISPLQLDFPMSTVVEAYFSEHEIYKGLDFM
jgi:hypothetical protein